MKTGLQKVIKPKFTERSAVSVIMEKEFMELIAENTVNGWGPLKPLPMLVMPQVKPKELSVSVSFADLKAPFPPEKELDLSKKYKGRDDQEIGWRPFGKPDGVIFLNELFQPRENCVVYGVCVVNAPSARKETLLLGSDDGVRVWLNDKLVWEHAVQRRLGPDDDRVMVELKEGRNLLLIKGLWPRPHQGVFYLTLPIFNVIFQAMGQ